MHLLFLDESGTPPPRPKRDQRYFVMAGVAIPADGWKVLERRFAGVKVRYHIRGEIKWRYFSPTNKDDKNPLKRLSVDVRDEIRVEIYNALLNEASVCIISSIVSIEAAYSMHSVSGAFDIYGLAYKTVTERFQYHLQDLSKEIGHTQYGIIVCDHRGQNDDRMLRAHHQKLVHAKSSFFSQYDNVVESIFLTPSHLSIGIQMADL